MSTVATWMRRLGVLLLAVSFAAPTRAQPADSPWPSYRSDAQNTARSPAEGPGEPVTRWRYALTVPPGARDDGLLAVGPDGALYVPHGDTLSVLRPDGSVKWAFSADSVEFAGAAPAIGQDGTIYAAGDDFYAFSSEGTLKWSYPTGGHKFINVAPTIGPDGTIYFGSPDSSIHAVNSDGTRRWTYETASDDFEEASIGHGGRIFIPGGKRNGNLHAFNASGSLLNRWSPSDELAIGSPTVGPDNNLYIPATSLFALDSKLMLQWRRETGHNFFALGPRAVLYGTAGLKIYSRHLNGSVKWVTKEKGHWAPIAVGAGGTIYAISDSTNFDGPAELLAIDPGSGETMWSHTIGYEPIRAGPVISTDRTIYVATDSAIVAIGDASSVARPQKPTERPTGYRLGQNYPNPFNPTTKITYQLAQPGHVKLEVFDLLGRLARKVLVGFRSAGQHTVQIQATTMPSGTYIYRISSGQWISSRTMTVQQ